jgi:hypothetical protein
MSTDSDDITDDATARAARRGRAGWRAALIFGIAAATIEMALVLWLAFC